MSLLAHNKARISRLFQRYPQLAKVAHRVWWRFQARFSAGAVGVIFNERGQLLLLEHVYRPRYLWGLPGGYVARHEDPADTLVRELLEETGMQIQVVAPLAVEQGLIAGHLDLAYLCSLQAGGDICLSSEILDYGWFEPDELPELLGFHQQAIQRALQLREVAEWV